MSVIFEAENYRGLKKVRWAPSGVCALVGPNGSGKTTLLRLPELFRYSVQRGFNEAVGIVGGFWGLRHVDAGDEPVVLRAIVDHITYQLRIATLGDTTILGLEEIVSEIGKTILHRDFGSSTFTLHEQELQVESGRLALRRAADRATDPLLVVLANQLTWGRVYAEYDLMSLRERGSRSSSDTELDRHGQNAFSVLRNWHGKLEHRSRYEFVIEGLRRAFPGTFHDVEYEGQAQSVSLNFTDKPTCQTPIPISVAPNGLLVGLLHLMAVAGRPVATSLALDEMENSLHPHAIRSLIGSIREWCEDKDITVVLATHSPVVLDCFNQQKENIFVMQPGEEVQPVRLTDLGSADWLAAFSAGQIYADEEVGAPVPPSDPSKR